MNRLVNNRDLYIGIDLGTTNIKTAVFDDGGNLLELIKDSTPITNDGYGQVYDPHEIFRVVKDQLSLLFQRFTNIKGISVTGMSESGLIMNRNRNKEESFIIPWFDPRTAKMASEIGKDQDEANFYTTGLHNSYKYGIYKYLWLLQNNSIEKEQTIWLSICDYIVWRLTNRFATDPTFATRTYVYDIVNKCWDYEKLERYGLTEKNFPKVVPSGSIVGVLEEKHLKSKSKGHPIPVCLAGHDHVCAAYAVLGTNRTRICNSIGTAETYLGLQQSLEMNESLYKSGIVYGPFVDSHSYFWMANISSSGQSVEWFRKRFQRSQIQYSLMDEMLNNATQEPTNILYYPYLAGIGTPTFKTEIGGALIGLRDKHDSKTILKAIIEGINYQGKWILSLVPNRTASLKKEVVCVGGPTNSSPWMQIKANILGAEVIVPSISEATLLGCVALMIEKNFASGDKNGFLLDTKKQVFTVDQRINEKYKEIFDKKFIRLLDAILSQ